MTVHLDRNERALAIGDKMCWYNGSCFGKILRTRPGCAANIEIKWDAPSDSVAFFSSTNLIKITEVDFKEFFEIADLTSDFLGRRFCDKFNILDRGLKFEACNGKARKRIIEWYAENMV